ncbi:MAG: hypothetical protein FWG98_10145 [Candidatus Cloacimonetes bacterium]|nr:hypothetical protein [Candidatus Cloacimonadota bacterium]
MEIFFEVTAWIVRPLYRNYLIICIILFILFFSTCKSSEAIEHNKREIIPIRQGFHIEWTDSFSSIPLRQSSRLRSRPLEQGLVFVWSDTRNGDRNIYAQLISPNGKKLWGENGLLIDAKPNKQESPVVTDSSEGNIIISYIDYSCPTSVRIITHKLSPTGEKLWGDEGIVVCHVENSEIDNLIISKDDTGGVFITWIDNRTRRRSIYAQHLSSNGDITWEENGILVGNLNRRIKEFTLLSDGWGGVVISYIAHIEHFSQTTLNISRLSINGIEWEDIQLTDGLRYISNPQICSDGADGFIFTWMNEIYNYLEGLQPAPIHDYDFTLKAQRVSITGSVLWEDGGVKLPMIHIKYKILIPEYKIVEVESGGVIFVWKHLSGFNSSGFFAQRLDLDGNAVWNENICLMKIMGHSDSNIVKDFVLAKTDDDGIFLGILESVRGPNRIALLRLNSDGTKKWGGESFFLTAPLYNDIKLIDLSIVDKDITFIWIKEKRGYGATEIVTQFVSTDGDKILQENSVEVFSGITGTVNNHFIKTWNGLTYIVWYDTRENIFTESGERDNRQKLYFQIIDADGNEKMHQNGERVGIFLDELEPGKHHFEDILAQDINEFGEMCIVWNRSPRVGLGHARYIQIINSKGERLLGETGLQIRNRTLSSPFVASKDYGWEIFWTPNSSIVVTQLYDNREDMNKTWNINPATIIENDINGFMVVEHEVLRIENISLTHYTQKDDYLVFKSSISRNNSEINLIKLDENRNPAIGWEPNGKLIPIESYDPHLAKIFLTEEHIVFFWIQRHENVLNILVFDLNGNILYKDNIIELNPPTIYRQPISIHQNESEFTLIYLTVDYQIRAQKINVSAKGVSNLWEEDGVLVVQTSLRESQDIYPNSIEYEGNHVVVWAMRGEKDTDIFLNVITSDGILLYEQGGLLVNDGLNHPNSPKIASHKDGNVSIIWLDGIQYHRPIKYDLYMKRMELY